MEKKKKQKSRDKSLIWVIIIILLSCILAAYYIKGWLFAPEPTQPTVSNPISGDVFDCHVEYYTCRVGNDKDDKPIIKVYYRFTNNSEKDRTFDYGTCTTNEAFQDGAKLDYRFGESQEEKDRKTDIKPGASIIVCDSYYLRNLTSPVDVTVKEYVPLLSKSIGTMTISLA